MARAYDEQDAPFRRFATAVMKYWVCKRAPQHALEALECLGGNGYVEESGLPRLLRDSPLNSIWEGSGNVAALDVLRATLKEPEGLPAFLAECDLARGADPRLDAHLDRLGEQARDPEFEARRLVGRPGAGASGQPARPQRRAGSGRRLLRRPARGRRPRVRHASRRSGRRRDHRARARDLIPYASGNEPSTGALADRE